MAAHGHAVALEGRACALACARFCPWFVKIICSPVTGTCLAELSKPCANLALPCSTTAFSWGPATKRKGKACERHSNVHLVTFFLLYLFGKHPYGYRIRTQEHEAETTKQQRHQVTHGSFFLCLPADPQSQQRHLMLSH